MKRMSPYLGRFQDLVKGVVDKGWATPETAEEVARAYVKECSCEVISVDRGDGPQLLVAPTVRVIASPR